MQRIKPVTALDAAVRVPGSKSLTQRALLTASLARGESVLQGPLASEDTLLLVGALRAFGVKIDCSEARAWRVQGLDGNPGVPHAALYLGNNGTATRFLTSFSALAQGTIQITGNSRMQERPIAPLLEALQGWGVCLACDKQNGCPPLTIRAAGIQGGLTRLSPGKSSQYLSSLLLVAPYASQEAVIEVEGELYSKPYVDMTLAVMRAFGVEVQTNPERSRFTCSPGGYQARVYAIEGDASSASYFLAAAALCRGVVRVKNLLLPSLQGDAAFASLLARMGCQVETSADGLAVRGNSELCGIEADMGDMPDTAPTLAVVAAFARGTSILYHLAHLRVKECDRVSAMAHELRALGVEVAEEEDRLIIRGKGGVGLHGGRIASHNDHRIAMSLALAGLRVPGVEISGEECVAKSFPDFWQSFHDLQEGSFPGKR